MWLPPNLLEKGKTETGIYLKGQNLRGDYSLEIRPDFPSGLSFYLCHLMIDPESRAVIYANMIVLFFFC